MQYEVKTGMVSIDGTDIAEVLKGKQRFSVFLQDGFSTKGLVKKIKGASSLLIGIQTGKNPTIRDCQKIVEGLAQHVKKNAKIIWGVQISNRKKMMVVAGW